MGIRNIFWKVISGKSPPDNGWVECMQVEHFEPYTPGQLTKNFQATVADEISVTRGTTVKALYRDDQWIYVQLSDGRRGFIPQAYCRLLINSGIGNGHGNQGGRRSQNQNNQKLRGDSATIERRWEKSNLQRFIDSLPVQKEEGEVFKIEEKCSARVLFNFKPQASDDLEVVENEKITILNCSDADWFYCKNSKNAQGFVPANFLKLENGAILEDCVKEKWVNESLLVIESFTARCALDLSVRPGEWIKCQGRASDDWLWVERENKAGFIPNKIVILATDL
ncbi:unnamed protein product [Caenorhabditis angaria]|uniref:SH3 domain-containing protein n=1 Tax=Caenorhabditis angaria TaxID=860376 RepID=A0A9P1I4G6_9PELO|nr:unnamed protein product [Caenorhabditis angaria]